MENTAPPPSYVVGAFDGTKERSERKIKHVVNRIRTSEGVALSAGDILLVLCDLLKLPHPMGYQILACPESFSATNFRAMEEEVRRKVEMHMQVCIEVKVTAAFPHRQVILQEVTNHSASWIILDRYLRPEPRFYLTKIPCKVALVKDDLSVDVRRSHDTHDTNVTETEIVYCLSKIVSVSDCHSIQDIELSSIYCKTYPVCIASSGSSVIASNSCGRESTKTST